MEIKQTSIQFIQRSHIMSYNTTNTQKSKSNCRHVRQSLSLLKARYFTWNLSYTTTTFRFASITYFAWFALKAIENSIQLHSVKVYSIWNQTTSLLFNRNSHSNQCLWFLDSLKMSCHKSNKLLCMSFCPTWTSWTVRLVREPRWPWTNWEEWQSCKVTATSTLTNKPEECWDMIECHYQLSRTETSGLTSQRTSSLDVPPVI